VRIKEVTTMTSSVIRKATGVAVAVVLLASAAIAFAQETRRLEALSTHTWRAQVFAGVPVEIAVDGDGSTDLDRYVCD